MPPSAVSFAQDIFLAVPPRNAPARDREMDFAPPAHASSSIDPPWPAGPRASKSRDPAPSPPPDHQTSPQAPQIVPQPFAGSPRSPNRPSKAMQFHPNRKFVDNSHSAPPPAFGSSL